MRVWIGEAGGTELLGPLPACVSVSFYRGGPPPGEPPDELPGDPATVEFWVPPFLAGRGSVSLVARMPGLRVIQLLSAGADGWVGRVPPGVLLCNARGAHDSSTAEWVMTAMLAYLRNFPAFGREQAARRWSARHLPTDELAGKRVLIVGAGSIGGATARRLAPFDVTVTLVARTARPGQGVHGVEELPALLPGADVVVLLVPLTDHTRGLVDRSFLAALPDGALLVNAARGPVVDAAALLAELATGRIGAALDVTDPEPLPPEHPLWRMPNVLITPHVAGTVRGLRARTLGLVGDQLRRYLAGEPLINQVVDGY